MEICALSGPPVRCLSSATCMVSPLGLPLPPSRLLLLAQLTRCCRRPCPFSPNVSSLFLSRQRPSVEFSSPTPALVRPRHNTSHASPTPRHRSSRPPLAPICGFVYCCVFASSTSSTSSNPGVDSKTTPPAPTSKNCFRTTDPLQRVFPDTFCCCGLWRQWPLHARRPAHADLLSVPFSLWSARGECQGSPSLLSAVSCIPSGTHTRNRLAIIP